MSRIDSLTGWFIDRLLFIRARMNVTGRESMALRAVSTETTGHDPEHPGYPQDRDMRRALISAWIYADIQLLARDVASAGLIVVNNETQERMMQHPFLDLMKKPNNYLTRSFMLQYLVAWLALDGNAYWYLAPKRRNMDEVAEIWPIPSTKMVAVPDEEGGVKYYLYGQNTVVERRVDPRYIVHFMLPNPFDRTNGLSILSAAILSMDTDLATSRFMKDFYVKGSGNPLSVISVSRDVGDRDFSVVEAQLRDDFEKERKIAIVRGGEFDVKQVGISQRDMEIVASRKFTRDEIDTIFLGLAYNDVLSRGDANQANKFLKERAIRPLHVLLHEQITLQLMHRFYSTQNRVEFEDIRIHDRALNIQEASVYGRFMSIDEARARYLALPPLQEDEFPGIGRMLVPWVVDPSFITLKYGLGLEYSGVNLPGGVDRLRQLSGSALQATRRLREEQVSMQDTQQPVPSLPEADSPERIVNRLAAGRAVLAMQEGIREELKRWKRVAIKEMREGRRPEEYNFISDIIPAEITGLIKAGLALTGDEEQVRNLFNTHMAET